MAGKNPCGEDQGGKLNYSEPEERMKMSPPLSLLLIEKKSTTRMKRKDKIFLSTITSSNISLVFFIFTMKLCIESLYLNIYIIVNIYKNIDEN